MKMVMDACTVILLAKASVLESAARQFSIFVPKSVYEEVMAGKAKKLSDALLAEMLVKNRLISVLAAKNAALGESIKKDFSMGNGEADAIALCLEKNFNAVATDNKQGRKAAPIYSIPLLGSPEIIAALARKGAITKEKAKQA